MHSAIPPIHMHVVMFGNQKVKRVVEYSVLKIKLLNRRIRNDIIVDNLHYKATRGTCNFEQYELTVKSLIFQNVEFKTKLYHDDVIKWKHFPRYWPFVRGIHRSPVYSPHKGQWRGASIFYLISAWINSWVNNRKACDLRRHCANYDVKVMMCA